MLFVWPFKVEEMGLPVTLILPNVYGPWGGTKSLGDVPSSLPKRTISCTQGNPNVMRNSLYKLIRYGLTNML